MRSALPTRQVHLDFHTPPDIPDLLADFDAAAFADTMHAARVNSVTVFAKCHHGMSYYPTSVGLPHPHLRGRDLLGEMIESLNQRGIRTPIYYTVGWEERLAYLRPEWRQVKVDGTYARQGAATGGVEPGAWWFMNFLHPDYQEHMREEVIELMTSYPVEGLFFDITFFHPEAGFSDQARAFRREHGIGSYAPVDQARFLALAKQSFAATFTSLVHSHHPNARPFYNSGHIASVDASYGMRAMNRHQLHWEIESLPSGFWGYFHFPRAARYVDTFGMPWIGMTGRFQRSWGDFGGIKPRAALEYECFRSQAMGGGNSVGDQLPPRGRLDPAAYDLIGAVFRQVEAAEPFYEGSHALYDVGVLLAGHAATEPDEASLAEEGVVLALEEAHYHPAVLDDESDLASYELVVLPDYTLVTDRLYGALRSYYEGGGRLLISYRAGFDERGTWALDFLPLHFAGAEEVAPTYWRVTPDFWPELCASDRVFYRAGMKVTPGEGVRTLIERVKPYFPRTDEHFMSHAQAAPLAEADAHPAGVAGDRFVYLADPVFATYRYYGATTYRDVVERLLHDQIGRPRVGAGLARSILSYPRRRGNDLLVTLLHYLPVRKAVEGDVIEEPLSFAGERLCIGGLARDIVVREYGGSRLEGSAESGFELPSTRGRLLIEALDYFPATQE
jgi:hypothetical protein